MEINVAEVTTAKRDSIQCSSGQKGLIQKCWWLNSGYFQPPTSTPPPFPSFSPSAPCPPLFHCSRLLLHPIPSPFPIPGAGSTFEWSLTRLNVSRWSFKKNFYTKLFMTPKNIKFQSTHMLSVVSWNRETFDDKSSKQWISECRKWTKLRCRSRSRLYQRAAQLLCWSQGAWVITFYLDCLSRMLLSEECETVEKMMLNTW